MNARKLAWARAYRQRPEVKARQRVHKKHIRSPGERARENLNRRLDRKIPLELRQKIEKEVEAKVFQDWMAGQDNKQVG